MYLKKKSSTTSGLRHQLSLKKSLLSKKVIIKTLLKGKKNYSGRGKSLGRITSGNRGGRSKNLCRSLNFEAQKILSIVLGVFYDPSRSVFISLCFNFLTKKFGHKLTTAKTYPGSLINSYTVLPEFKLGCIIPLFRTPTGSIINSIITNKTVRYIKSAGVYGVLLQKDMLYCKIKLPSGEIKLFSSNDSCVLGSLSNRLWNNQVLGKAGKSRLLGRRPHVRGVAMNPVDHPHGGNTSTGRLSVTPWAKPALGKPTKKIKRHVKI